ncbi:MAG: hypothetical protein EKK56_00340 [Flavobacteriaceae bacterium]|nr:MAG: hypothetical protein EKK56_00340 [Flavobacteriaceae bacterium]
MKNLFLLFILLVFNLTFAQVEITVNDSDDFPTKKKVTFSQFEISVPLQGNKNRGEVFPDGSTNDSWFVPDGINSNFGYGIHFNQWLGISANSGIGMKLSEKLIVTPVFSNLRFMPKVGDETRFGFDFGLGHAFAIGRGDLSGTFKRVKLNLEASEFQIFLEVVSYGIRLNNNSQGSINLGIALISF